MPIDTDALAQKVWDTLTPNEKAGVRVGLFPAAKMRSLDELTHQQTIDVTCKIMDISDKESKK